MQHQLTRYGLLLLLSIPLLLVGCDDDDDAPTDPGAGEEEVITDVVINLTGPNGTATLSFSDPDGEGGNAPTISGATLAANTAYAYTSTFTNATETPAEDVTVEIREEDDEHQIFWDFGTLGGTLTYGDFDGNNRPLGVTGTLTTGMTTGDGSFTMTLRHEPTKDAAGVADGDITNAGGETDVEIAFPITIQ